MVGVGTECGQLRGSYARAVLEVQKCVDTGLAAIVRRHPGSLDSWAPLQPVLLGFAPARGVLHMERPWVLMPRRVVSYGTFCTRARVGARARRCALEQVAQVVADSCLHHSLLGASLPRGQRVGPGAHWLHHGFSAQPLNRPGPPFARLRGFVSGTKLGIAPTQCFGFWLRELSATLSMEVGAEDVLVRAAQTM